MATAPDVTALLLAWRHGDRDALDRVIELVHHELHRLAHRCMLDERPGHALQTTALINEVYVRLVDVTRVEWRDRAHFFAMCGRLMRRILVDFARSRESLKRGRGTIPGPLLADVAARAPRLDDLLAIDQALDALAAIDSRKAHVIELRFFGGLSVEEAADALEVSPDTVMRDWRLARAWLLNWLRTRNDDGS